MKKDSLTLDELVSAFSRLKKRPKKGPLNIYVFEAPLRGGSDMYVGYSIEEAWRHFQSLHLPFWEARVAQHRSDNPNPNPWIGYRDSFLGDNPTGEGIRTYELKPGLSFHCGCEHD